MEGDACYKFTTIKGFLAQTGKPPVTLAIDIGANVGSVSLLMASTFPEATVLSYEAVEYYHALAAANCAHEPRITVFHQAITAQHLFADDLGQVPGCPKLQMHLALPNSGAGWGVGAGWERLPRNPPDATGR